jgi:hypothetical protein
MEDNSEQKAISAIEAEQQKAVSTSETKSQGFFHLAG